MTSRPIARSVAHLRLRTFGQPDDVERWLELRHRAFARQRVGVRTWSAADFAAEFLTKGWWMPERLWFAETPAPDGAPWTVGTVTLALRGTGTAARPVVHWLAVLPEWRRRGVARLLMAELEAAAWDAGYREIYLETHAGWTAAAGFYQELGYRPAE
jgi:GNAT superfamily N-acetyltransferase